MKLFECYIFQNSRRIYISQDILRKILVYIFHIFISFLARDVIYTSRAFATMSVSVCLSVTEVHWRIIANLRFKFRSKFTARTHMHCECMRAQGKGSSPGRVEGSSRAVLATARPSCSHFLRSYIIFAFLMTTRFGRPTGNGNCYFTFY